MSSEICTNTDCPQTEHARSMTSDPRHIHSRKMLWLFWPGQDDQHDWVDEDEALNSPWNQEPT